MRSSSATLLCASLLPHAGLCGEKGSGSPPSVAPPDGGDMDADGDGRISEAEFLAPMREAFASMDADGSGFVEAAERGAGRDVRVFTHRIERDGGDD